MQHKEEVMRNNRLVLLAMLLALPFAVTAKAQVGVGVGVGPAVVDGQSYDYAGVATTVRVHRYAIGALPYYPYACAPYGYYGPQWFVGWRVYRRRTVVSLGLRGIRTVTGVDTGTAGVVMPMAHAADMGTATVAGTADALLMQGA